MFPDYQALVLAAYQNKRKAHALSPNFINPSPAKLKEECLLVCQERYLKKDEKLLRSFFEPREDKAGYMLAIKSADIDKFRPLCNFLKDATIKTSDKNIELLAWLIGFEPRPYQIDQVYKSPKIETEPPVPPSWVIPITGKSKRQWYAALILLLVAVIGIVIYNIRGTSPGGCMVWTGNQYKATPCSQQNREMTVIAIDSERLVHFKKIDKPDTITGRALGKVWYFKSDGQIEYYTGGGAHPIYPDRRLKPLTLYMLNKYIRHL